MAVSSSGIVIAVFGAAVVSAVGSCGIVLSAVGSIIPLEVVGRVVAGLSIAANDVVGGLNICLKSCHLVDIGRLNVLGAGMRKRVRGSGRVGNGRNGLNGLSGLEIGIGRGLKSRKGIGITSFKSFFDSS